MKFTISTENSSAEEGTSPEVKDDLAQEFDPRATSLDRKQARSPVVPLSHPLRYQVAPIIRGPLQGHRGLKYYFRDDIQQRTSRRIISESIRVG